MGKARGQSKLMRFLTTPCTILGKARDFYVRSITSCADKGRYCHSVSYPGVHFASLPKTFSGGGRGSNDGGDDFKELLMAASLKTLENRVAMDVILQEHLRRSVSKIGSKKLPKICSVQMGRIDEDKACEFEEDCGDTRR